MLKREEVFDSIKNNNKFDAVIVGGGSSGLGIGLDLTTRGYKVLVVEKHDYAKATSSRSTKILHGGVRYLEQLNFSLVRDSLLEKNRLFNNAPHLTKELLFSIPFYSYIKLIYYFIGLMLYYALAGFPKGKRPYIISKKELAQMHPQIKQTNLKGGLIYYDGAFDDSRLTVALVETIFEKGSFCLNYTELADFIKTSGVIKGVILRNTLTNELLEIESNLVINATGIFSDEVRGIDDAKSSTTLSLSQGIHLVFKQENFSNSQALLIPKTTDGRVLFAVPWYDNPNYVLLGTTDTKIDSALIEPKPLDSEIEFILRNINGALSTELNRSQIESVYAGVRPLIKSDGNTKNTSREEKITFSESGLVSVIGGKWTSYRRMSEKLVDEVIHKGLLQPKTGGSTKTTRLYGYSDELVEGILRPYGSQANVVKSLGAMQLLHPDLPYFDSQVIYAVRYEQAVSVDDVLARRLRVLFVNAKLAIELAPKVANLMAKELGKDSSWVQQQVKDFTLIANNYLPL